MFGKKRKRGGNGDSTADIDLYGMKRDAWYNASPLMSVEVRVPYDFARAVVEGADFAGIGSVRDIVLYGHGNLYTKASGGTPEGNEFLAARCLSEALSSLAERYRSADEAGRSEILDFMFPGRVYARMGAAKGGDDIDYAEDDGAADAS